MLASRWPKRRHLPLSLASIDGSIYAVATPSRDAKSNYCKIHKKEEEEEEEELYFGGKGKCYSAQARNYGPISVVILLKECANKRDLQRGSLVHAQFVTKSLLVKDLFLASTLVNMYVKCGALLKAQEVFNELPSLNLVACNSLIAGYVQHGRGEQALDLFECMQQQGLSPDGLTFTFILKACSITKAADKGQQFHAEAARKGLLKQDNYVGTALLDMYARCGMLKIAQEVFDQLAVRNVVSWTALIAGYAQQGNSQKALMCFERMQRECIFPNAVTFVFALKACGSLGNSKKGQELHAQIVDKGLLSKNIILGTALVDMYSKCGLLDKAQEVFDQLSDCNVVTWNALILGYAKHGLGEEALTCFFRMRSHGIIPNDVTFLCLLKECARSGRVEKIEEVHVILQREGRLLKDLILINAVIDTYAKCGLLIKAQETFDGIRKPNVVTWNSLITGYAHHGGEEQALTCFDSMQLKAMLPDTVTYACIFKACGSIEVLDRGLRIHAQIVGSCLMAKDTFVANALVDMYAKCGAVMGAKEVFDRLAIKTVVSWTALIGGYAQHGHKEEALNGFYQMQQEGLFPDAVTFACVLRACDSNGMVDEAFELHTQIINEGLHENDIKVGTALIDMYTKCGMLSEARDVFDELPFHDVVSWTVLIAGYAQSGHGREAIQSFEQMQLMGFCPDAATYASVVKACVTIGAVAEGQVLHAQIVTEELFEQDVVIGTVLIDFYTKCGALAEAQDVFNELPAWNVISWNALLNGYAQLANGDAVLDCFERMQCAGASLDLVTFTCIAGVCGNLGAAFRGQVLHGEMVKRGLSRNNLVAGNTLVHMYANCCMLEDACNVLQKLPWDVVSWNALMAGYAQLGNLETILGLFQRMVEEELNPNPVTFTIVLSTCSHGGLLDEGQMVFEMMRTCYCITPNFEHCTIIIDLFGRAGLLDRAEALIGELPFYLSLTVWHTLLGACQKWENLELGRWAYKHALQLDELDSAAYVSMGNICATANRRV